MSYKAELKQELKQAESDLEIVLTMEEKLEKFCKEIEGLQMRLSNRLIDNHLSLKDYLCDWISDHIVFQKTSLMKLLGTLNQP